MEALARMVGSGRWYKRGAFDVTNPFRIKTVVRRTFAAYAGQARVLLPAAAVSFVILAGLSARPAKAQRCW
ncbi:MAG TPA: hypothetical protein VG053_08810 [Solirubrobacteraceae bacterium]|jgi:hypothetical protein|nr:hypothetical protein [Solirubrobacteraceae bacterium]